MPANANELQFPGARQIKTGYYLTCFMGAFLVWEGKKQEGFNVDFSVYSIKTVPIFTCREFYGPRSISKLFRRCVKGT